MTYHVTATQTLEQECGEGFEVFKRDGVKMLLAILPFATSSNSYHRKFANRVGPRQVGENPPVAVLEIPPPTRLYCLPIVAS